MKHGFALRATRSEARARQCGAFDVPISIGREFFIGTSNAKPH
jgi:hypothetical protein